MPNFEIPQPSDLETNTESNHQKSIEVLLPEIDELSKRTSLDLEAIDRLSNGDCELPERSTPALDRFRKSIEGLKDKTPQELISVIDPEKKLRQSDFSFFEIKENPSPY